MGKPLPSTSAKIAGGNLHRRRPPTLRAVFHWRPQHLLDGGVELAPLVGPPFQLVTPLSNTCPYFSRKYSLGMQVQDCPFFFLFLTEFSCVAQAPKAGRSGHDSLYLLSFPKVGLSENYYLSLSLGFAICERG